MGVSSVRISPQHATRPTGPRRMLLALGAWAALVVIGAALVAWANARGQGVGVAAPPLHAHLDPDVTAGVVLAIACAAAIARHAPRVAATASWHRLLVLAWSASVGWGASLALVRGAHRLTSGLRSRHEYLHALPLESPGRFLSGFVDRIAEYPVHVEGHPPGFVLLLQGLDGIGLGGARVAAVLCIGGAAAAVPAVLLAARALAGEDAARRAAPFLVLAPAAVWAASSADGFFLGVSAWAVTLVVLAIAVTGPRRDGLALAGGLLFGVTAFLSYGLVLLGAVPLVVAVARRSVRPIVMAIVGALPVAVAFAVAGFWWFDGLLATRDRYFDGIASRRPYEIFVIANLAALAIALGPAIAPAIAMLRDRGLWLLVGGALLAVVLADVSGMSKAEVERIWLPFMPWILVAGASLGVRHASASRWLAAQAATAIVIELLLRTPW